MEGAAADTFSVAAMVVELFAGAQPFREVRSPLIEYCCSGLRSTMTDQEKREAVENHLNVREVTRALPLEIEGLVSTWFRTPT